jgi:ubiquinone/menaquinone biosynthesis C-methylase UbiE
VLGRIEAFVERMNIQPADRVLEIGCGHGVAATLICSRLRTGRYVAIDRSARMIEAATHRNAEWVRCGKAEFVLGDLEAVDLGKRKFNKVFAMRVSLFYRDPDRARAIASRWLTRDGRLFVEYDTPCERP